MNENEKKEELEILIQELKHQLNGFLGIAITSNINKPNHISLAKKYLQEKNNEFLNKLKNEFEMPNDFSIEINCAQFLQFLSQITRRISVETREDRRKYLFEITKNYFKISKYLHLDKQLMFLYMLDSISDTEISFLMSYYNKIKDFDFSKVDEDQYTMQEKLTSVGLIGKEIKNLQLAFKLMTIQTKNNFENMVKEINKIRNQTESYYDLKYDERFNAVRDSPTIAFTQTMLGLEFVSFLLGDDSIFINQKEKRLTQVKENISNAVMKFRR